MNSLGQSGSFEMRPASSVKHEFVSNQTWNISQTRKTIYHCPDKIYILPSLKKLISFYQMKSGRFISWHHTEVVVCATFKNSSDIAIRKVYSTLLNCFSFWRLWGKLENLSEIPKFWPWRYYSEKWVTENGESDGNCYWVLF